MSQGMTLINPEADTEILEPVQDIKIEKRLVFSEVYHGMNELRRVWSMFCKNLH